MNLEARIYIAGHRGLLGSALVETLKGKGYRQLLTRTHEELDLLSQKDVERFFTDEKPDYCIIAAGRVGGIQANISFAAEFIYENVVMQANIIHAAYLSGVKKLLFYGSACGYPAASPQPIKEEYLFTGPFESTNQAYAIAKVSGIGMCQAYNRQYGTHFIVAVPTNIYGPQDNFDDKDSHVVPALMRRSHEAKMRNAEVMVVWGTGNTEREFIFSYDAAEASYFLLQEYDSSDIINIGTGEGIAIAELAEVIRQVVGFKGRIQFDPTHPDGMQKKVLDVTRLNTLGWKAKTSLRQGLEKTYQWFLETYRQGH